MNCDWTTSQFIKHRGPMITHVRFLSIPWNQNSAVSLLRSFVYRLGLSRKRSKRPSFGESQAHRAYLYVYIYIHMCMYIKLYIHFYLFIYLRACIYIYIHRYVLIYIASPNKKWNLEKSDSEIVAKYGKMLFRMLFLECYVQPPFSQLRSSPT
jgi:hypothetical protein